MKAVSVDLRKRVVAAVDGGISRNQAAARFGVSIASAVRWCDLKRRQGDVSPKRQGGDRKSGRKDAEPIRGKSTLGEKSFAGVYFILTEVAYDLCIRGYVNGSVV